jgi:hypothetical protein
MASADRTLAVAEQVAALLQAAGVPVALIGAGALAVHGYPRATEDLDLAVSADPFSTPTPSRRRPWIWSAACRCRSSTCRT